MYINTSFAHNIATRYELKNETAVTLNQSSSTEWFNPAAATRVESRKLMIDIEFTTPVFPIIHGLFLPVVHIKPTGNDELVQISTQLHLGRPHAFNLIAVPLLYLFFASEPKKRIS